MNELIPTRFLFRFEIPIFRLDAPPTIDGRLNDWDERFTLPPLHAIEGQSGFARALLGWHETGLYFACEVTGKQRALRCDAKHFWKGDNIRVMTDMRDAREARRATRFCQQFYFLPTGGGKSGASAVGGAHKIQRAQADAPRVSGNLPVASVVKRTGYTLEAHLPAEVLSGFRPADNPRIGIYTIIEDSELGRQFLTIGDDLCWYHDPSTWATGVLAPAAQPVGP